MISGILRPRADCTTSVLAGNFLSYKRIAKTSPGPKTSKSLDKQVVGVMRPTTVDKTTYYVQVKRTIGDFFTCRNFLLLSPSILISKAEVPAASLEAVES